MKSESRLPRSVRQLVVLLLGAGVVIFAYLNQDPTQVDFLGWKVRISTALLVLVPVLIGFVMGWIEGLRRGESRGRETRTAKPSPPGDRGTEEGGAGG